MAVIFRYVTDEDLDYVFSLEEIDKISPFLGDERAWCRAVDQHRRLAIDEATGYFIMNLPQLHRDDATPRYLMVCDGKVILSPGAGQVFAVQYISPSLRSRLEEFTPFLREVFGKGGKYLEGESRPHDLERAKLMRFNILNAKDINERKPT